MSERPYPEPMRVRRFDGTTFDAGVPIPDGTGDEPHSDLTQDPAGRLHALWPRIDADTIRLNYATSNDGVNWVKGSLATGETFLSTRAAAASDHIGLVVWHTGTGTSSEVHYLSMGPEPPAPPATPPPTTPPPAPIQPPATYAGSVRPVTVRTPGASITFTVPRGCVHPGQRFRVTLKWKRKKRKGNLFVKVRRADFYLGTRRVRVDKKVPFVYTFRVLVTQPRGSTIRLRARAFIKVKHGRSPKKSIFATIKVCA